MLGRLPYANLLTIHNALTGKPADRCDTHANGERRTAILIKERDPTLEAAARLVDVVLPETGPGLEPDAEGLR
jgi:hypothetical protein